VPRSVVEVPDGSLVVDTSARLSAAQAAALAAASWQGRPVVGVIRYVGLSSIPWPGDVSAAELDAILDAGLLLGLVQHCRRPDPGSATWHTTGAPMGSQDGAAAVSCARRAGYLAGCHLACDLEDCGSSAALVTEHVEAWADEVSAAGYLPLLYVGFCAGLDADQLYALPGFAAYWCDAGPRAVSVRGFCLRQHATVSLAGLGVDPDVASADALGGRLRLLGSAATAPTDPAPAT
jgi:hypothetical protein